MKSKVQYAFGKRFTSLLAMACFCVAGAACANDSLARVGVGGLVLLKTNKIRMEQEVLEVSTQSIRVKYQFKNDTAAEIRATVAFPLPEYRINEEDSNAGPVKDFKVFVEGSEVPTRVIRKAMLNGREVTAKLRKIGLSDAEIFDTFGECLDARCNVARHDRISRAIDKNAVGRWRVAETIYWEQSFPAGKSIEVRHEYKPFNGMTYRVAYQERGRYKDAGIPWAAVASEELDSDRIACVDDGTRKAIAKRVDAEVKAGAAWVWVTLNDVEYILGTGRNWKGPIADFQLRIVKEFPEQVVSLCFPGKPVKLDPHTLVFSHKNFVPQDRLIVYFYSVTGTQQ